jgi:hypothetical protein
MHVWEPELSKEFNQNGKGRQGVWFKIVLCSDTWNTHMQAIWLVILPHNDLSV